MTFKPLFQSNLRICGFNCGGIIAAGRTPCLCRGGTKWQQVVGAALQGAKGGVLWTSEAESLPESEHSRGRRRGALPPNGVFIFCAATLSCLHLSSGSWLLGLPLIPLDAPLSPPGSSLGTLSGSFLQFSFHSSFF